MLPRRRRPRRRPLLRRARQRMERANPAEAAAILEKKAQAAEQQGLLDKSGDLHLEAARCYLQLDDVDRADEVHWIDPHSAECAYCGGIVKAT
jgi:hypothetical protein